MKVDGVGGTAESGPAFTQLPDFQAVETRRGPMEKRGNFELVGERRTFRLRSLCSLACARWRVLPRGRAGGPRYSIDKQG